MATFITLYDAVLALNGGQKGFRVDNDGTVEYVTECYSKEDFSKIEIDTSSFIVPSKKDVLAKYQELKSANQYKINREAEYPSIEELVVGLYDESDKASIIERRKAVKAKYPKPE